MVFRHDAARSGGRPDGDVFDGSDDDELEDADDGRTMRRVVWFAAVIVVLLLVQTFLFEAVRVRSDSMSPSYQAADVVMVDKLTYHFRDPRIDEVVVTEDPRTGQTIVKRVVAVGGDTIGIDDGRLVRNGQVVFDANIDNDNMDGYFHGPRASCPRVRSSSSATTATRRSTPVRSARCPSTTCRVGSSATRGRSAATDPCRPDRPESDPGADSGSARFTGSIATVTRNPAMVAAGQRHVVDVDHRHRSAHERVVDADQRWETSAGRP